MAVLPFGGLGIGIGPDGIGPQVSIGAAWIPDRVLGMFGGGQPVQASIHYRPNRHQQQGLSRKSRQLYGPTQPANQPPKSTNFDNLFG